MRQLSTFISLIVVARATALMAGSITLSSGNVKTQGNQVITGAGARAEATVDQRGSVVRLGSNTAAQVGDRGDVSLAKGVVLVSSGDGFLRRPPVQVSTPQGAVTVRGSAIVAALPDGSVKMTCLEGSVRGDLGGQGMALNPGNLIVQRHEGTRDAVQVDLNALTASSALLDSGSFKQALPAATEIRQEVAQQAQVLGATLTLPRNDSNTTQSDNKTVEVKSDGPGLLTRIFGGSTSKTADNATGPELQMQGNSTGTTNVVSSSQGGTSVMRLSGAVSGSNVLINGTVAPSGSSGAGAVLVVDGSRTVVASAGDVSGSNQSAATLVRAGSGTLTLNSGVVNAQGGGPAGAALNSGTLVLSGQAAQQFQSGNLTVNGGTLTPVSNSGGVIIFQAAGGAPAPPPAAP